MSKKRYKPPAPRRLMDFFNNEAMNEAQDGAGAGKKGTVTSHSLTAEVQQSDPPQEYQPATTPIDTTRDEMDTLPSPATPSSQHSMDRGKRLASSPALPPPQSSTAQETPVG